MTSKTIQLNDAESNDDVFISIRDVGQLVGFAISLEKNGDIEIFLNQTDFEKLLNAVSTFKQERE